jgi:phosphoglycolate phosphatase
LKQASVEHCFTDIYGKVSIFGKAPMLKRLVKTHKLNKGTTIYIGDEARDLEATNQVGIRCVAVSWGFASRGSLEAHKPWAIVDSVPELADTIPQA